jgi:hypothetical protein
VLGFLRGYSEAMLWWRRKALLADVAAYGHDQGEPASIKEHGKRSDDDEPSAR